MIALIFYHKSTPQILCIDNNGTRISKKKSLKIETEFIFEVSIELSEQGKLINETRIIDLIYFFSVVF